MKTSRLYLSCWLVCAVAAASLHAQLMDVSFDVGARFRDDAVETNQYFRLPEGSSAHFNFRFNPEQPFAEDDYVRIRMTDPDGGVIFNEHRALDRAAGPGEIPVYSFAFTNQKIDGPLDRRFYENLVFEMSMEEGWVDESGAYVPPAIQIDHLFSELYVSGWSPMIQYVPPGYSGRFLFAPEARNVAVQFVPVPEPSTYGLAALVMLGAVSGWRRWRTARMVTQA
jgi:hypothetical protein